MSTENERELETLIRRWEQAVCDGELPSVMASHGNDLHMFDVPEPLENSGLDAYREGWELFFSHVARGPDRFRIKNLKIVAGETVAFARGLLNIGGGPGAHCRLTLCFEKRDGQWQFVHEHHSMPIKLAETA